MQSLAVNQDKSDSIGLSIEIRGYLNDNVLVAAGMKVKCRAAAGRRAAYATRPRELVD